MRRAARRVAWILAACVAPAAVAIGSLVASPASAALLQSSWPMWGHDPAHSSHTPFLGPANPILLWSFNAGTGAIRGTATVDAVGDIYFGTSGGRVFKVQSNSSLVWTFQVVNTIWSSSPALSSGGDLFIGCGGSMPGGLYSLTQTGSFNWSFYIPNQGVAYSSPAIDSGGVIYVGNEHLPGVTAAFQPNGTLAWSYVTGHEDSSPCLDHCGNVYSNSKDSACLHAISPQGAARWTYPLPGWTENSPMYLNGLVYTGTMNGVLLAVNSTTGALAWSYNTGSAMSESAPSYDSQGQVYMTAANGNLYAWSQSGTLNWTYGLGANCRSNVVSDATDSLYVADFNGRFTSLSSAGALRWTYDTGGFAICSFAIAPGGRAYAGTFGGTLYCLADAVSPTPTTAAAPTGTATVPCTYSATGTATTPPSTPTRTTTPSASATRTESPTSSATGTRSATATASGTDTVSPTLSPTWTSSGMATASGSPSATFTPASLTNTMTYTPSATQTRSATETSTATPAACTGLTLDRNAVATGQGVVAVVCGRWTEQVSLRVFNSAGELVRVLWEGTIRAGERRVVAWDLSTDSGTPAASNVYVFQAVSLTGGNSAKVAVVR